MHLALYTTVYPAVLPFLWQWAESVVVQSCQDFELWIGIDGIDKEVVRTAAGRRLDAHFVNVSAGATPAEVRNQALAVVLNHCDAVALVDSDDILLPTRVEGALSAAEQCDLTACAMDLVDSDGDSLGIHFDPARHGRDIVHNNVFGFSNTTWRSQVLQECLPVPEDCVLMDWMVAVKAHLKGATTGFDTTSRMFYRQHAGSMAFILPPYSMVQVITATKLLLGHYERLIKWVLSEYPGQVSPYQQAYDQTSFFAVAILADTATLERYVEALNALPFRDAWWSCVAHPELEDIWKK